MLVNAVRLLRILLMCSLCLSGAEETVSSQMSSVSSISSMLVSVIACSFSLSVTQNNATVSTRNDMQSTSRTLDEKINNGAIQTNLLQ